jgi:hypothetical protein
VSNSTETTIRLTGVAAIEIADEAARAKPKTEPLTDEMVRALRVEADAASDWQMANTCGFALARVKSRARAAARRRVADAINAARAMDDETPFVRVVAR